ncbi:hypothetical protein BC567DRAFT_262935 [Phyllosticta citribraziliensis]
MHHAGFLYGRDPTLTSPTNASPSPARSVSALKARPPTRTLRQYPDQGAPTKGDRKTQGIPDACTSSKRGRSTHTHSRTRSPTQSSSDSSDSNTVAKETKAKGDKLPKNPVDAITETQKAIIAADKGRETTLAETPPKPRSTRHGGELQDARGSGEKDHARAGNPSSEHVWQQAARCGHLRSGEGHLKG